PIDRTQSFAFGEVVATLPAGMVLYPWQQFLLAMVSTSLGDRPIYFASSGNAAADVGLAAHLVREGLAFRLHPGPLPQSAPDSVEALPRDTQLARYTGAYVNVPRTRTLLNEVFVHRSGLPDWDHWPDHATIGIPNYYAW